MEPVADRSNIEELTELLNRLRALSKSASDSPETLLHLLRELESVHRDVLEGPFRASLPANRQKLFTLLQGMEKSGGWPYIPRLQLRTFLDLLDQDSADVAA